MYSNQNVYLVEYDSVTGEMDFWEQGDPTAGNDTGLNGLTKLTTVPTDARFFALNFYDPKPASTGPTDPFNVARISVLNKANEVAQVIKSITALTGVPQVNILAHSMGGLDARAYVENMASSGACYDYSNSVPDYYAPTCSPGNPAYANDVANIITLDTPHNGSSLAGGPLKEIFNLLLDDLYKCQATDTTNSAELVPGNKLLNLLNYSAESSGGVSPTSLGTPVQAVEDYFSDDSLSWTGLAGNSDDIVLESSQSITQQNLPTADVSASLNDLPIPYLSTDPDVLKTSACWAVLTTGPMLHRLDCIGALPATQLTIAIQLAADSGANDVGAGATTSITSYSAVLNGVVNTNNVSGIAWFQFGQDSTFGAYNTTHGLGLVASVTAQAISSSTTAASYQFSLSSGTTYYYRTVFQNSTNNQRTYGGIQQFTTLATPVTTGAASSVTSYSAVLNGTVNPGYASGLAWFQFSQDSTFGTYDSTHGFTLVANAAAQAISSSTTTVSYQFSLSSGTTYYYRTAFFNSSNNERVYGPVQQFTTLETAPAVTLSAASISFAATTVGVAGGSQSVTLTNTGTAALSIASIALAGADPSSFVFANNCGSSLAAGASCTIHGHFAPKASGALTAAITITDNAGNSPQSIGLSGTGVAPPVTLSAHSLSYAPTTVGAASGSQSVTLTYTGTAALSITGIAVTGTNASSFVFGNNCGTSVAAGASCSIHGHFAPTAVGALTAAVTISDSASTSPQTIALSGTGLAVPVTLSAKSLSYGSVDGGSSSGSQSVTLTNNGSAALSIASIALTGADASSFLFGNTCGTSLAAGASCTIHGHFAPTVAGVLTAAVTITDSASTSPQSIALSGTGVAATKPVTLSATSLTYPATTVGTASGSQSVTMTNTGTAALTITSIAVTGADKSSFVFANNCGASLAVGASCTIHGHFAPAAQGALTAAVTITDSAAGSPQSIALSGTGQ